MQTSRQTYIHFCPPPPPHRGVGGVGEAVTCICIYIYTHIFIYLLKSEKKPWNLVENVWKCHFFRRMIIYICNHGGFSPGEWTGGRSILVQTGDVTDRGDASGPIFQSLFRLQEPTAPGWWFHQEISGKMGCPKKWYPQIDEILDTAPFWGTVTS